MSFHLLVRNASLNWAISTKNDGKSLFKSSVFHPFQRPWKKIWLQHWRWPAISQEVMITLAITNKDGGSVDRPRWLVHIVATLMISWRSTWKCDFFNLLVWNHLSETLIWKWMFQFLVLLVFECNSCIWSDKKHNKTAGYLIKASTHKFMEYRDSWKQNKKKYSLVGWYYLTTCAYVFPADCYGCQYCIICLLEGKLCTYHI